MDPALAGLALNSGWVPATVDLVALALLAFAVVGRADKWIAFTVATAAGAAVGLLICWLATDQLDLFGVSLSPVSRAWVSAAFGGVAAAVEAMILGPRRRRIVAGLAIPALLIAGAFGVNADFGQYPTVGSLTGRPVAAPLPPGVLATQASGAPGSTAIGAEGRADPLWQRPPSGRMPDHGLVGSVSIPGTQSHFPARPAYIYLPPAALTAHPARLPVLVLLSGQPGGPANVVESGKVAQIFDAFARTHHGVAPIVVAPDQLTAPQVNPMCVDSAIGRSAMYLTVDLPRWIRQHLTVQVTPDAWAIGGFSEGGTCSLQLGAAHPELFGGIVDVAGEIAPSNGDESQTIDRGFGGSRAAYRAALPLQVLAAHHYGRTVAILGTGEFDVVYGPIARRLGAAMASAGMRVSLAVSPGTSHDWHTVQWVLRTQLDPIYRQFGLEGR